MSTMACQLIAARSSKARTRQRKGENSAASRYRKPIAQRKSEYEYREIRATCKNCIPGTETKFFFYSETRRRGSNSRDRFFNESFTRCVSIYLDAACRVALFRRDEGQGSILGNYATAPAFVPPHLHAIKRREVRCKRDISFSKIQTKLRISFF
ncbi:hypothetical protein PUN28_018186 [Cardiocondyla obscurior]|uniref:Uncharacterized protein n=1 Tax=Cardiocondyla obscurior TaxID=286306 RepID=A0AAW2ELK0_9HYME